ncbi:cell wall hydrolase [Novosphingobium sp. Gsoil 351]|uniref:cell wall hydrolase n=1 Tax=Novosphingobium sp. Gsoil 351 TaxID=2675225 RepID=UPI001E498773|nr:cell wall hydrolase [Novosphingobium sp. Gsoil 351]
MITTLVTGEGSGAAAQPLPAAPAEISSAPGFASQPVVQPLPAAAVEAVADEAVSAPAPVDAASLSQLVAQTATPSEFSNELACLAGAIYFEAKGETLAGQLAVGRVIVARAKSGRFPASYCGVVYQRSQFSFVQGHGMPAINKSGRAWTEAARIARIAHEGSWKSPVEGALFFHAARVSPNWRLTRLARIDNHIFYR